MFGIRPSVFDFIDQWKVQILGPFFIYGSRDWWKMKILDLDVIVFRFFIFNSFWIWADDEKWMLLICWFGVSVEVWRSAGDAAEGARVPAVLQEEAFGLDLVASGFLYCRRTRALHRPPSPWKYIRAPNQGPWLCPWFMLNFSLMFSFILYHVMWVKKLLLGIVS